MPCKFLCAKEPKIQISVLNENFAREIHMKKKLAILLMMLMISVSLAGCVSNDADPVVETKEITDSDSDGVPDSVDNCPDVFNPDQF